MIVTIIRMELIHLLTNEEKSLYDLLSEINEKDYFEPLDQTEDYIKGWKYPKEVITKLTTEGYGTDLNEKDIYSLTTQITNFNKEETDISTIEVGNYFCLLSEKGKQELERLEKKKAD